MSTENFDSFTVMLPNLEGWEHLTDAAGAEGGRRVRKAKLPSYGIFRVRQGWLRFPPNDVSDFKDFFNARQGAYDSWLYMPVLEADRSIAAEALGTGDGSTTDFALDSKYLKASTLVVKVDSVVESGVTLVNNNTTPLVRFDTAPSGGEVLTADYDRYVPVTFDQDGFSFDPRHLAGTDDDSTVYVRGLTWTQNFPGSHLVSP
jgi:hypothetical protein